MGDTLITAVQRAVAGSFDVLGEIGQNRDGTRVFLARERASEQLVAVWLGKESGDSDSDDYALRVTRTLDGNVPAGQAACPTCAASLTDWRRFCADCGQDVSIARADSQPAASEADPLDAIRSAAGDRFELLGTMTREEGGGQVFMARDLESGRIVALALQRTTEESDGAGVATLGVTQLMRSTLPGRPLEADLLPTLAGGPAARATPTLPASPAPEVTGEPQICASCGAEFGPEIRFCPNDGTPLRSRSRDGELTGRLLNGTYRVLTKIGEGGMGHVFLGEQVTMARRCAIKVLKPSLARDLDAVSRFRREAANASRISHRNVARVYDFGETEDRVIYLAMEYVDGESLGTLLQREGRVSVERATSLARQIAEGLGEAHNLGIVHRDLKPYNVLVDRADGDELAKVVDFGIAKAAQGGSHQDLTRTGFLVGTPEYMSPEQLLGEPLDGRSDLYALGCLLFQMLAGEHPFAGATRESLVTRRLTEEPPRVRTYNPEVPRALDEIVAKALARSPADRFQNAEEFCAALDSPGDRSMEAALGRIAGWWERRTGGPPNPTTAVPAAEREAAPAVAAAASTPGEPHTTYKATGNRQGSGRRPGAETVSAAQPPMLLLRSPASGRGWTIVRRTAAVTVAVAAIAMASTQGFVGRLAAPTIPVHQAMYAVSFVEAGLDDGEREFPPAMADELILPVDPRVIVSPVPSNPVPPQLRISPGPIGSAPEPDPLTVRPIGSQSPGASSPAPEELRRLDNHLTLAELDREQNDFSAAIRSLQAAERQLDSLVAMHPDAPVLRLRRRRIDAERDHTVRTCRTLREQAIAQGTTPPSCP
jgi:eukaryotic-like serine/threonine-protein kinase